MSAAALGFAEDDQAADLQQSSAWDVALRYHEFKSRPQFKKIARTLRKLSAEAIIERATAVLGSVVRPTILASAPLPDVPGFAEQVEFDIDETLENQPLVGVAALSGDSKIPVVAEDLWVRFAVPRRQALVLNVDTSLSMTGEKLALTAVALAVVLLEFPDDPIGIVAFENEASVLKHPGERISIQQLVERFLDVPAQGYTHLEDGMRTGLKLSREAQSLGAGRPASVVLLTDGKYTAGRDPAYLAPRHHHLVVLKMGKERASLEICQELARLGHGSIMEVGELEVLPIVMYSVVKDLLRGRTT